MKVKGEAMAAGKSEQVMPSERFPGLVDGCTVEELETSIAALCQAYPSGVVSGVAGVVVNHTRIPSAEEDYAERISKARDALGKMQITPEVQAVIDALEGKP